MNNKERMIKAFGSEVKKSEVDTFRGWLERGRVVMQKQKSLCKLSRPISVRGETQFRAFSVFHISQTTVLESNRSMAEADG